MLTTVLRVNGRRFVQLAPSTALGLTNGSFTIEAWCCIDPSVPDAGFAIVSGGESGTNNRGLHCVIRGRFPYFGFWANDLQGRSALTPGVWYHLAYRFNLATSEQAIFINGVLDASTRGHPPYSGLGDVLIGQAFNAEFFVGWLGEVRIFNYARSDQEIAATRWTRLSGAEDKLVGYWPLSDGNGTIANDMRRTATGGLPATPLIRGRITPDAEWEQRDLPIAVVNDDHDIVSVAQFFGRGDCIVVPPTPLLNITTPFTVEAWVQPAPERGPLPPSLGPVVSRHGNLAGWELRATPGGCSFIVSIGKTYIEATAPPLPAGEWGHIAGVYDGQNILIVVNGAVRGAQPAQGAIDLFPAEINIGRNPYWPDRSYAGSISDVRIWTRPRSVPEIATTIHNRLTGREPGLCAYYPLGGPVSATDARVRDFTAQENYGLIKGASFTVGTLSLPPALDATAISSLLPALLQNENQALRMQLAQATAQLQTLGAMVSSLQHDKDSLAADRNDVTAQLTKAQGDIAALKQESASKDDQLRHLREQIEALNAAAGGQTQLEKFIGDANQQIKNARDALKQQGSTYSLGRVQLDLKMIPAGGGTSMRFPSQDEMERLGPGLQLSNVSVELISNETAQKPEVATLAVPSLLGYTEVMAKRKLGAIGLIADMKYQAIKVVPGDPVQADRIVSQVPQAGTQVAPSSTVTLFIGRPS